MASGSILHVVCVCNNRIGTVRSISYRFEKLDAMFIGFIPFALICDQLR